MEYKLSKYQIIMLSGLLEKKSEAKKIYEEIAGAELELYEMIIKKEGLPDANYRVKQVGEDIILFSEDAPVEENSKEASEDKKITKTKEKKES